jgi:predicted transcriptional regulator
MNETRKSLHEFYETQIKDVMQVMKPETTCVDEKADVTVVFNVLNKKDHVWVTASEDPTKLVGIITESDIIALLSPPLTSFQSFDKPDSRSLQYGISMTAGEIMSKKPVTTSVDEKIKDVLIKMKEQKIKQVPVVDKNNHLLGEVSLGHLIKEYSTYSAQNLEI